MFIVVTVRLICRGGKWYIIVISKVSEELRFSNTLIAH